MLNKEELISYFKRESEITVKVLKKTPQTRIKSTL